MKYQTVFSRSFSRYEQKSFSYGLIIGSLIIVWSICMVFLHYSDPISVLVHLQLLNSSSISQPHSLVPARTMNIAKHSGSSLPNAKPDNVELDTKATKNESIVGNVAAEFKPTPEIEMRNNEQSTETEAMEVTKPNCNTSEPRLSHCEIKGKIMIHGNSSTIFLPSNSSKILTKPLVISPYARKDNAAAMQHVTKWHVNSTTQYPSCAKIHKVPAILFSIGGFSGNSFHDFSDIIIPLYITTKRFNGEVQFLVSDYRSWWISKFNVILKQLSYHQIINIDSDQEVRCYEHLIIGLDFHKELSINRSNGGGNSTMDFKEFLRNTFLLNRTKAVKLHGRRVGTRPRLMIISRKKSRSFANEQQIVQMATILGFNVTVAEARLSTNLSSFAQDVNSCDVLLGVHGAGLTNMVFLPESAVVIQIIPFGKIEGLARKYFKEPTKDMSIKYLEYKIRKEESSLAKEYPMSHAIISDPMIIHRQGWEAVKSIYLDKQNVKLDLGKFRVVLLKALKLLHS